MDQKNNPLEQQALSEEQLKQVAGGVGEGTYPQLVYPNDCIGCGVCVEYCWQGAITLANDLPSFNYDLCTSCLACVNNCPTCAIE